MPLTPEQIESYREMGYLHLQGLIPDAVSKAAADAMWRVIQADPYDRSTWARAAKETNHTGYTEPLLVACYTREFLCAAETLAEDRGFKAPDAAYVINVFPTASEWTWPSPHIDHAIEAHGHKTFPRAFRVATMTFLSDVEPRGGGTIVWPGSHKKIEALALSDPQRFEMMHVLNTNLDLAGIGEPLELTPRRGDVLMYHTLCAHSGSQNVTEHPRLAMNAKW